MKEQGKNRITILHEKIISLKDVLAEKHTKLASQNIVMQKVMAIEENFSKVLKNFNDELVEQLSNIINNAKGIIVDINDEFKFSQTMKHNLYEQLVKIVTEPDEKVQKDLIKKMNDKVSEMIHKKMIKKLNTKERLAQFNKGWIRSEYRAKVINFQTSKNNQAEAKDLKRRSERQVDNLDVMTKLLEQKVTSSFERLVLAIMPVIEAANLIELPDERISVIPILDNSNKISSSTAILSEQKSKDQSVIVVANTPNNNPVNNEEVSALNNDLPVNLSIPSSPERKFKEEPEEESKGQYEKIVTSIPNNSANNEEVSTLNNDTTLNESIPPAPELKFKKEPVIQQSNNKIESETTTDIKKSSLLDVLKNGFKLKETKITDENRKQRTKERDIEGSNLDALYALIAERRKWLAESSSVDENSSVDEDLKNQQDWDDDFDMSPSIIKKKF